LSQSGENKKERRGERERECVCVCVCVCVRERENQHGVANVFRKFLVDGAQVVQQPNGVVYTILFRSTRHVEAIDQGLQQQVNLLEGMHLVNTVAKKKRKKREKNGAKRGSDNQLARVAAHME